ncbi:hypothetical protein ABTX82_07070 [Streptomyces lavendulae]|uniref:hypothetical protein n=2 Tax=Streptomyces lavendulae TaxID=1914 RepID=UPI0024A59588|nr:hypothetical protein [Streptomyces lavendulae]GLV99002.1 hypothetical protein Slala05_26340 [Streptomyces lavendulae subsp. lavendulae]
MGIRDHQTSRPPGGGPAYPAAAPAGTEPSLRRPVADPGEAPQEASREAAVPGRWRYTRHLDRLAAVAAVAGGPRAGGPREAEAVAAVLRDPDPVMAESAVVTHLDRRALRLLPGTEFPDWARALHPVLDGHAFPARRLREWSLLKAIEAGTDWNPAELAAASDWCQNTAARSLASHEALILLAASARTRRVRNTAAQRLRRSAA